VPACENLWIEINQLDKKDVIIGVVYRHPRHDHGGFQEAFQENIIKINKTNSVLCLWWL